MLTLKYILGSAKDRLTYGEPEHSFSPRWHQENPYPRTHREVATRVATVGVTTHEDATRVFLVSEPDAPSISAESLIPEAEKKD